MLHQLVLLLFYWLIDRVLKELSSSKLPGEWGNCTHGVTANSPDLNLFKNHCYTFRFAVNIHLYHPQPLSQKCKLLHKRNDDYLTLRWLIIAWKIWSHAVNLISRWGVLTFPIIAGLVCLFVLASNMFLLKTPTSLHLITYANGI